MIFEDLRYSLRTLAKAPLMSITALVALALGIGANTALFSVIDAVLLRPLNYPQPESIVELVRHFPAFQIWATTPTKFDFWRRENKSLEATALTAFLPVGLNLSGNAEPQMISGLPTTDQYFRVFRVNPLIGRTYSAREIKPGAGHFAVLSYGLWQRLFHGDPNALGKSLSLSNQSYEIIGVMPRGFDAPQHPDLWMPLQVKVNPAEKSNDYSVVARLRPGVTLAAAQQDLKLVGDRFRQVYGSDLMSVNESIGVINLRDYLVGDARQPLWILMAAVGLVLLIACANVANLLLARSTVRRREMAIRVALGATGARLIRQLLTESLLLSFAGALGGWLLASSCLPLLLRLAPADIPQLAAASIDLRVLLFTLAVAVLTGLLFGFFPALQSARLGIANPLREAGTRTTGTAASQRVRQSLVIAEVAVSLVLLIGAGLLIKTMAKLQAVHPGFDPHHVLTMRMAVDSRYHTAAALGNLNTRVVDRLKAVPGVLSVASTGMLPMTPFFDLPFEIIGRPTKREEMPDENYRFVSAYYFSTLRIPVLQGREFTERDTTASAPVAIVNAEFAAHYFPHQNAIGQQILIGRIMGPDFVDKPRRIVGVVGGMRDLGLNHPAPPEMFEPEAQVPDRLIQLDMPLIPLNWVIRTAGDPMALASRIRRATLLATGDLPMADAAPLSSLVQNSLARERFLMSLLTIFAGLALLLGTVGLYGVISYSVAQRTRELGVRSALGARRTDLLRLVVGTGMRLAVIGLVIGLAGAFALTRFLQSLLFGVSRFDPPLLISLTLLMGLVALAASFVPAWRASRIDPVIALREE